MTRYERWKNGESIADIVASYRVAGGCTSSWSGNGFLTTTYCNEPRVSAWHCQEHYAQICSKATFPGLGNLGLGSYAGSALLPHHR